MRLKLILAVGLSAIVSGLAAQPATGWHDYYNPSSYTTPIAFQCYGVSRWEHPSNPEPFNRLAIDIPMPVGTPIWATKSGYVTLITNESMGGISIWINHYDSPYNNGLRSVFSHLSQVSVSVGQFVTKDITRIGYSGNTGTTTGPHLHWGMYEPDTWQAVPPYEIPGVNDQPWESPSGYVCP